MPGQPSGEPSRSLARLLADLPAKRLQDLADHWQATPGPDQSLAAALYRRMIDETARQASLASLPDSARLVFATLAARGSVSTTDLLQLLPFTEDDLGRALEALGDLGLAWSPGGTGRSWYPLGRRWVVPEELAGSRRRVPSRPPGPSRPRWPPSAPSASPPVARPLDHPPDSVLPVGLVPRLISQGVQAGQGNQALPSTRATAAWQYAEHAGVTLGIWERRRGRLVPGRRAAAWRELAWNQQVRALARLWLIDERSPRVIPSRVRQGIWRMLWHLETDVWYDLRSIGPIVAWCARAPNVGRSDRTEPASQSPPGRSIAWHDVEIGLQTLAWIGIVALGSSRTRRLAALQRTPAGQQALAEPADVPGDPLTSTPTGEITE